MLTTRTERWPPRRAVHLPLRQLHRFAAAADSRPCQFTPLGMGNQRCPGPLHRTRGLFPTRLLTHRRCCGRANGSRCRGLKERSRGYGDLDGEPTLPDGKFLSTNEGKV